MVEMFPCLGSVSGGAGRAAFFPRFGKLGVKALQIGNLPLNRQKSKAS